MLMPGTWDLTLSADGYRDTVVTGVVVNDYQRTDLVIDMEAVTTDIDSTFPELPLFYPNPADRYLNCTLPENMSGSVTIRVINSTGNKTGEYREVISAGVPLVIDLGGYPAGSYTLIFTNDLTHSSCLGRVILTGKNQ
jgi:hypothetical protein